MLIRIKNPVEETFILWMNNHPESFHHLDMQRFYSFVKNKIRYKSNKWDNYNYFEDRILKINKHFAEDNISYFYHLMQKINDFVAVPMICNIIDTGGELIYGQRNVINDKIITVMISKEEFLSGGISLAEIKKRVKEKH